MVLKTAEDDDGRRLDRVIRKYFQKTEPDLALSTIHRLFRLGKIRVDGKVSAPDIRVKANQTIEIRGIEHKKENHLKPSIQEHVSLPILFQNYGLLAVNKAPGLIVHGKNSLEDLVLRFLDKKIPSSLSFKPGPLHRLDKQSSGVLVFSYNLNGARFFSSLLREQKVKKIYLAVVDGIINKKEIWEDQLIRDREKKVSYTGTGKSAFSAVTPLARSGNQSLISVEIKTGRTHQIRAQASSRGHPLSGDTKYGGKKLNANNGKFFLHALTLEFTAPDGEYVKIKAPLPEMFAEIIKTVFTPEKQLPEFRDFFS